MQMVRYFFKIIYLLCRYELDQDFLPKLLSPSRLKKQRYNDLLVPEKFRFFLESLGPLWVKFGQILSTRYDVFPEDWLQVLSGLQDSVTPFSDKQALEIIRKNIPDFEEQFKVEPGVLASASIAQVYAAQLKDGSNIVLKVLRPNVKKLIKRDLSCLRKMARVLNMVIRDSRRLHLIEVVDELGHSLHQEINFLSEAANASTFSRNFAGDVSIKIPKVYWEFSSEDLLVLERVPGIPIYDLKSLREQNINLSDLAVKGVNLFFTQVLRDSFFHADMHPGNIFVDNGNFALVDFGIVGSLNSRDQRYIAENMLAFFKRDYRRVAILHIESGWVPSDTRVDHFEAAIRQVCEPIFARPLKDISFAQLFLRLLQTAREYKTEIQPQLILLQKTLLQIESIGRMLDPNLDLWSVVQPPLEQWVQSQMGWQGFKDKSKDNLPYWLEHAPDIPGLLYKYLSREASVQPVHVRYSGVWPFIAGISIMALLYVL